MGVSELAREVARQVRRRRGRVIAALLVGAGAAMVASSLVPGSGLDDAWTRDLLMTLGSSLILFAPLYIATRTLDNHLDQVAITTARQVEEVRTEVAASASSLTAEVEALRADVDVRLETVVERAAARLRAAAEEDRAAIAALRHDPTREVVLEAIQRAHRLHLVSERRAPRIKLSAATDLYVAVVYEEGEWAEEPLTLRTENSHGYVHEIIEWPEDRPDEDVLVALGEALWTRTGELLEPSILGEGLADLLEVAMTHPRRRPAIEWCAPQWLVCDWGIVSHPEFHEVPLATLRSSVAVSLQAAGWTTWLDRSSWDAARTAATKLFRYADPWAVDSDEPPI